MDKTMRAAFIKAPYQVEVREVPIPEVSDEWALIKVEACGICGSDMHTLKSEATDWQSFGHEVAGVVAAKGREVHNVKEGDKVVLESGSYNPYSNRSRDGRVDLDNTAPSIFIHMNTGTMGFADYILAHKQSLVPYEGLSPEVACLAEPIGVAVDMTYTADIRLGNDVMVMGLGAIGLMSIPLVRMQGASRIYAVNRSGGKRAELAKALGAQEVILTQDTPLDSSLFRKGGVDRALVSADPRALPDVMRYMNYGGFISFIGISMPDSDISFSANDFHFKKLQLRASHAAPALYFPTVLQLLQDKHLDGEQFISHILPLDDIAEGIRIMRDERESFLKIVIKP